MDHLIKSKSAIHLARVYSERLRYFTGQHIYPFLPCAFQSCDHRQRVLLMRHPWSIVGPGRTRTFKPDRYERDAINRLVDFTAFSLDFDRVRCR
jgi:hypothetical protein